MSVLEAIYQVVGHVQQHVGQIILLTKQMLGDGSGSDDASAAVSSFCEVGLGSG